MSHDYDPLTETDPLTNLFQATGFINPNNPLGQAKDAGALAVKSRDEAANSAAFAADRAAAAAQSAAEALVLRDSIGNVSSYVDTVSDHIDAANTLVFARSDDAMFAAERAQAAEANAVAANAAIFAQDWQPEDELLTSLAGLDGSNGVLVQTGAATVSKLPIGVGASDGLVDRQSADGRYTQFGFVANAITNATVALKGTAPTSLDTLGELANAIGNDAAYSSTITAALATKGALTTVNNHEVRIADLEAASDGAGLRALRWLVAERMASIASSGSKFGFSQGYVDSFNDATGIDANTTTHTTTVTGGYKGATDSVIFTSYMTSATLPAGNTVTGKNGSGSDENGSLAWRVFGSGGEGWTTGNPASGPYPFYLTRVFPTAFVLRQWTYSCAYGRNFDLEGSNDGSNWYVLDSLVNVAQGSAATRVLTSNGTAYSRYRIKITVSWFTSYNYTGFTSAAFYEAPAIEDHRYTLQSAANATVATAYVTPSHAMLTVACSSLGNSVVNTDLVASVSRDGGAHWAGATLVPIGSLPDGSTVYEDSSIDLTGQPSGTDMRWKIVHSPAAGDLTSNPIISAVALQWRT